MSSNVLEQVYQAQEAKGKVEGEQGAVRRVLAIRFGAVPEALAERVTRVTDSGRLAALLERAVTAPNLADFERILE